MGGATQKDRMGFTFKQMLSRVDADSVWLRSNLVSYAEFPPLVSPMLAKGTTHPQKKEGALLHPAEPVSDLTKPILRFDAVTNRSDQEAFAKISTKIGADPSMKDADSYQQFMFYNYICYAELVRFSPRLAARVWAS